MRILLIAVVTILGLAFVVSAVFAGLLVLSGGGCGG